MRSPEQSSGCAPLRKTSKTILAVAGAAALTVAAGWAAYEGCIEPKKEWQRIPEPSDVPVARDVFSRRILAIIEEPDDLGYPQRLEFLEDGFTVATGGREFDIRAVIAMERSIDREAASPYLDAEGVRAIADNGTKVTFSGPYGQITLSRHKIVEIMKHLRGANKEGHPLTVGGIPYDLKAEVLFCDIEKNGECQIEFVEKPAKPTDNSRLAMQ